MRPAKRDRNDVFTTSEEVEAVLFAKGYEKTQRGYLKGKTRVFIGRNKTGKFRICDRYGHAFDIMLPLRAD